MKYFSIFSGVGGFEHGIQKAVESINRTEDRRSEENKKGLDEEGKGLESSQGKRYSSEGRCDDECSNCESNSRKFDCVGFTGKGSNDLRPLQQGTTERPEELNESEDKLQQWECVGFSEVDKFSIQTYLKHFPSHKNWGDATKINAEQLPDFDLLCGGFPCQAFSIAGKREGTNDPRGTLFWEICKIAKHKKPSVLFLENVKGLLSYGNRNTGIFYNSGTKTYSVEQTEGSKELRLGVPSETFASMSYSLQELGYLGEAGVVNSKNFGVPQNRERVFIIGHSRGQCSKQVFPIGQSSEESCGTSGKTREEGERVFDYVANTISQRDYKGGNQLIQLNNPSHSNNRLYDKEGISPSLNTAQGGNRQPKIAIPCLTPNRPEKRQNGRRFKEDGEEMFTLTGQDVHGVMVHSLFPRSSKTGKGGTGHLTKEDGTSYCVDTGNTRGVEVLALDLYNHKAHADRTPECGNKTGSIRRLTPTECERLQSFPDSWTKYGINEKGEQVEMSDSQRYKQMGNAVTVNVIEAIMTEFLRKNE